MKFEVIVLVLICLFVYDAYYCGGKYMRWINSMRRYYKTIMYVSGALFVYALFKSNSPYSKQAIFHGFNVIKHLPLERGYVNSLGSIFDMTGGGYNTGMGGEDSEGGGGGFMEGLNEGSVNPLMPSRTPMRTKRSVSEAKKRYVAASQNWQCASCKQMLNHTFEVDHKLRLEFGGSNEVSNLAALCRNCHGVKTAKENIEKSDL